MGAIFVSLPSTVASYTQIKQSVMNRFEPRWTYQDRHRQPLGSERKLVDVDASAVVVAVASDDTGVVVEVAGLLRVSVRAVEGQRKLCL
jgi:hypothetical protein